MKLLFHHQIIVLQTVSAIHSSKLCNECQEVPDEKGEIQSFNSKNQRFVYQKEGIYVEMEVKCGINVQICIEMFLK